MPEDEWLWGWDPTPGIVSVWAEPDGRAFVWRRLPDTLQLVREELRFRPWLLLASLEDLQHLGPRLQPEGTGPAAPGTVTYRELSGPGRLRHLVRAEDGRALAAAVLQGARQRLGRAPARLRDLGEGEVLVLPPEEQYLVATGRNCFRDLVFEDLRRLQFDLETTGLDPLRDRVFLHHEHINGFDAIAEPAGLDDGYDLSVAVTATTRTVRTHHPARGVHRPQFALELGSNVADFAWTFDGENAANQVIVLGTGDGSDREETSATDPPAYADGLVLETVFSAPPGTPIDSLEPLAVETLTVTTAPDLLSVSLTPTQPGQPDPVGVLEPGDTIPVRFDTGAFSLEAVYRVVELTVAPTDTVDLGLNRRDP